MAEIRFSYVDFEIATNKTTPSIPCSSTPSPPPDPGGVPRRDPAGAARGGLARLAQGAPAGALLPVGGGQWGF